MMKTALTFFALTISLTAFPPQGALAAQTSTESNVSEPTSGFVGVMTLPNYSQHALSISHYVLPKGKTELKDRLPVYFYGKYFTNVSRMLRDSERVPLLLAFDGADLGHSEQWVVYKTGFMVIGPQSSEMYGPCQFIRGMGDEVGLVISEVRTEGDNQFIDFYALPNVGGSSWEIREKICDYREMRPSILTMFPNAKPFVSFPVK